MIPPSATTPVDDDATGRKNMQQLIQLRWIAVLGQVGTILVVFFVFRIELPLLYMFAVLACCACGCGGRSVTASCSSPCWWT